ncbi:MAG: MATE family efflux transporter [Porticoccus sp.]|nr:MATE family efflux transporter [Porticoccus sp.]MBQ0806682.1 MATE family efflux transporter [Porticoccus sp.]
MNQPHRQKVLSIALPMTFASVSIPLLGLVDTAILGHLEQVHYLGAVAAGSSVLTMFFWLFAFLRMGSTGLTARAWGADDHSRCLELLAQSLVLAALLGSMLVIFQAPLLTTVLNLIKPSDEVRLLAFEYCQIRIFAAPATLGTLCAMGWLLGLQRAKATLLLVLLTNLANIGLDFLFIVGLDMNSKGAAWASFTAELFGFALALVLVAIQLSKMNGSINRPHLYQWPRYRELLRVNRHLFVRTACLVFTMVFFTAQGARQGDSILAANAILMQLLLLVAYTQDGFAHAAESLTGHAVGMNNLDEFYLTCKEVTFWGLGISCVATVAYLLFSNSIIAIFTDLPEVATATQLYWPWLTALPLAGLLCFTADGIFIGTGKTRAMQDTMLLAAFGLFLPLWYFSRPLGNHGLWLSYLSFLAIRSLLMSGMFIYYSHQSLWAPHKT